MHWLFRLSLLAMLLALVSAGGAASWNGGRGAGFRGAFPDTPFPLAPRTPAMVWKSNLGPGYADLAPSNTILAGDMIVVAFDRYLVGISAMNGTPLWRQDLTERPMGDLLYIGGQVVVSLPRGYVAAFAPATGALLWRTKLSESIRNMPVVSAHDLLYTTKANIIQGIDPGNGTVQFTREANDKIEASPAILGRSLMLCYMEGEVARLDEGGVIRWSVQIPHSIITLNPVTDGKFVVITAGNALYAVDPQSREEAVLWSYSCPDRFPDSVVLDNNRVYLVSRAGTLFCLDLATGKDLWTHPATSVDRDKVVTTSKPGIQLLAAPVAQPMVFGNHLLVRMDNGLMALYRKDTGRLDWLYRLKTPPATQGADGTETPQKSLFMGAPAITPDKIVFAASDGCIYYLSTNTPDVDPPSFTAITPAVPDRGFLQQEDLQMLGAVVDDEGCGISPSQVFMKLDGKDLTSRLQYDPKSGYFYFPFEPQMTLAPGLHRLMMAARDFRGNMGTFAHTFLLGYSSTAEQVEIKIGGEFLPKTMQVRPGTIVSWVNNAGDARTVVADSPTMARDMRLTSDILYPDGIPNGESWVWLVPQDVEYGTIIYYHCRLHGQPGDGKSVGTGLAGMLVVTEPPTDTPANPGDGPNPVKPVGPLVPPPGPVVPPPGPVAPAPGPVAPAPGPVVPPAGK